MDAESDLAKTDYKVIKNAESIALDLTPPYDPHELHEYRQPLRDTINSCEIEIERLKSITPEENNKEVEE